MKRLCFALLVLLLLTACIAPALAGPGHDNYNFRLCIYDRNRNLVGECSGNTVYLGDLSASMSVYPTVRFTNYTDRTITAASEMTIDGSSYSWSSTKLQYGSFHHNIISSDNASLLKRGLHTYRFKVGSHSGSGVYSVYSGTSSSNDAPNFLDINYFTWKQSGSKLKCRFRIKNNSPRKTVRAVELYVFAKDVWGNDIYGTDQIYYDTTTAKCKPGDTFYSEYFVIPQYKNIYNIYCGVHKISYTDGSSYVAPSDGGMAYVQFTVNK